MKPNKDEVTRRFGRMSHAYAASPGFASGADLAVMVALLEPTPTMRVLDVATGAGHTAVAVAPRVGSVVAVDLTPEMIDRTRELAAAGGLSNLEARVMEAEALDFADGSFDAVTCRIAAHHFLDVEKAVREIGRVLRPGGRLVLEDSCAPPDPELDAFINQVERLRDATHVRAYTEVEWRRLLTGAGLSVVHAELFRKRHHGEEWLERSGLDEAGQARVRAALAAAPPKAQRFFEIVLAEGRLVSFTDEKLILRADKA